MTKKNYTLHFKAKVVDVVAVSENVKGTVRKHGIQASQIIACRRNTDLILEQAEKSPKKFTFDNGPKLQNKDLEIQVYKWVLAQREAELAVSAIDVIGKATSVDSEFRNADFCKLHDWVYQFMKRRNVAIRTRTRKSQVTNAAMQDVKEDFCPHLMTSFKSHIDDPRYFINMDEAAVYLNCAPNRTGHPRGERTVSTMDGGGCSAIFTLAVCLVMDGSKLPLFIIFKGVPGGRVDKSLQQILPEGVIGCVQRKEWMGNRTMGI